MAKVQVDLTSVKFPFAFNELSSCVIVPKLETQRTRPQTEEAQEAGGYSHAYYLNNTFPVARGFASVAFTKMIDAIEDVGTIQDVFELRGNGTGLALLVATATDQWIYDADLLAWAAVDIASPFPGTTTVATVKGQSYIFIEGSGIYLYNFVSRTVQLQTVLGLDMAEINGICAAGAYLIAWTKEGRIFWSSNLNPLDFVPSLSTGAGSTSVLALKSEIVCCLGLGDDFVIYSSANAVSARQTTSVQFPFVFQEIIGSVGINSRLHVAYNSNTENHISWTPQGFQSVTSQKAEFIWPELRDGISRGIKVTIDALTQRPKLSYVDELEVRLQFCGNGYVVVSTKDLAATKYTEAYVYDIQLGRWGKLDCEHVTVFTYTIQQIEGRKTYAELDEVGNTYSMFDGVPLAYRDLDANPQPVAGTAGKLFGVLGVDGAVHVCATAETENFRGDNVGIVAAVPRIYLGRFKLVREQSVLLNAIIVNKLWAAEIVAHGHGFAGEYVSKFTSFAQNLNYQGYWLGSTSADSLSIEFAGSYTLTDLSLELTTAGMLNPVAVPPRKKFYSYINSVPYPIYVTENYTLDVSFPEINSLDRLYFYYDFMEDQYRLNASLVGEGSLSVSIAYPAYALFQEDRYRLAATIPVSGTLDVVIAYTFYTLYQEDRYRLQAAMLDTGTIDVVITYTFVTLYQEDKYSLSASIIGTGTLS
jgi:hypothetical protein